MRKRWIFLLLLLLLVVATSCSKNEPTPDQRFSQYIKLWNENKFDEMYAYLSENAKKDVTKKEFVDRYEKLYKDLEIKDLDISFKTKEKKEDYDKKEKATIPFSAKMQSIAGEIAFDKKAVLVKQKDKNDEDTWYLDWNSTYIFADLGKEDKVSLQTVQAKRGEILDRNENPLAINGIVYTIGIVPEEMGDNQEAIIHDLAKYLQINTSRITKALEAKWVQPNLFVPIKKIATTDQDTLNKVLTLPGIQKQDTEARVYPYEASIAHLIGYVGDITAEELEKNKNKGYTSTDVIGKRGLEQLYEEDLKGKNGAKILIKRVDGSTVLLAEKKVENGKNVHLTIDINMQQDIYNAMDGEAGSAAAINPKTGETLALVSSPSYNPNKMVAGLSNSEQSAYNKNDLEPFTNRFKNTYAPGSVLKPLVAAAALTEGVIKPSDEKKITSAKWQKSKSWGNYYVTRVHSNAEPVNLANALLYSDNIYFAQLALNLGESKYKKELKKFGFEEEFPYVYPMEKATFGDINSEILLADSGYGQGHVEMNSLQIATAYTAFVNDGNIIQPVLLKDEEKSKVWKKAVMSKETATTISNDLLQVIENPSGTGHAGKVEGLSLAGKTGTAELKEKQGEKGTENGWFVAYKKNNSDLLVSMMVEGVENKGGSKHVVEKVKTVFEHNK